HDFKHNAPLELVAGRTQERSHRTGSPALFSNHLAEIAVGDAQLNHSRLLALHLPHPNFIRLVHERACDELNKLFHTPESGTAESSGRLHFSRSRRRLSQQAAYCLGRLGPPRDPIVDALAIENDLNRLPAWVVVSEDLDKPAIALGLLLGHHDAIDRLLLRAFPGQSDY